MDLDVALVRGVVTKQNRHKRRFARTVFSSASTSPCISSSEMLSLATSVPNRLVMPVRVRTGSVTPTRYLAVDLG